MKTIGKVFAVFIYFFQKEIHDLQIQLTAITASEQHYSKQIKDMKAELEKEKYVFHIPISSLCTHILSYLVINKLLNYFQYLQV